MNEERKRVRLGRLKLLLVPSIFIASFVAAWIVFQSGWRPAAHSHGEAILPQRSFQDIRIAMDNGGEWAWRDPKAPRMTLIALSTGPCAEQCVHALTLLRNARITLNDKQNRVRLLHIGPAPTGQAGKVLDESWQHGRDVAGALAAFRPARSGAVAAVLVESNGTALVKYPAGFNADGVKDDLHKVIH
ncbi:MAG TPA: hypothetical protein VFJ15_09960 [Oleiagrimonas sp.]|nr:hypothetical protein [Oleiagrimonas sp.]